jgi:TIR domain
MSQIESSVVVAGPAPINIFISHKAEDKSAAIKLKEVIDRNCRNITCFLSCDCKSLDGGTEWREEIENALDKAFSLYLIYTTPHVNWDWCIYESGYFAGRRGPGKAKLVVLHPHGVRLPDPLSKWNSIAAEPSRIFDHLEAAFPGGAECHIRPNKRTKKNLTEMAKAISGAIAPLDTVVLRPNKRIIVVVPPPAEGAKEATSGDIPEGAYLKFGGQAGNILGLVESEKFWWSDFRTTPVGLNFDVPNLAKVIKLAREQRTVPASLECFQSPNDNAGYRPLVSSIASQKNGGMEVELMLAPIPSTASPQTLNDFERVLAILGFARRFRREVVEKCAEALSEIDLHGDSVRKRTLLTTFLISVNQLHSEVVNQGLADRARLLEAFEKSQSAKLNKLMAQWDSAKKELDLVVNEGKACEHPGDIVNPMRAINLMFLRLATERLRVLTDEIRPPDLGQIGPPYSDWIPDDFK